MRSKLALARFLPDFVSVQKRILHPHFYKHLLMLQILGMEDSRVEILCGLDDQTVVPGQGSCSQDSDESFPGCSMPPSVRGKLRRCSPQSPSRGWSRAQQASQQGSVASKMRKSPRKANTFGAWFPASNRERPLQKRI